MTNKSIVFLILLLCSSLLYAETSIKMLIDRSTSTGGTTLENITDDISIDPNSDSGVIANYSGNGESLTLNFVPPNQASIVVGFYDNAQI